MNFYLRSLPGAGLILLLVIGLPSCSIVNSRLAPEKKQLTQRELAVIVNQADPLSVQIGEYYQQKRSIPKENIISVRFAADRTSLSSVEFKKIKEQVDLKTGAQIQGYALTWSKPYRVDCMSITSAFAFGFDDRYCAKGCAATHASAYFRQDSARPYDDFHVRPTMAIAATNFQQAKALIDRGVTSDGTYPAGSAYLLETSDKNRNVRSQLYPSIKHDLASLLPITVIKANALEKKPDVMFYFTGLSQVEQLETNQFLPGAIADHLTSAGGMLTDSPQMSSLRWLEVGATGSYGAVVEPCNFLQKFPHPGIILERYLAGDTLMEAYWKSVAWPGQGIFIGEPLARPYSFTRTSH